MLRIFILFFSIMLCGCQTAAQFDRNMLTWKGLPIEKMIQQWGYPNSELTSPDGNKVYVYVNSGSFVVPQTTTYNTNSNIIGNSVYSTTTGYTTGGYALNLSCIIYVEFGSDKIIKNITSRGNNCVA